MEVLAFGPGMDIRRKLPGQHRGDAPFFPARVLLASYASQGLILGASAGVCLAPMLAFSWAQPLSSVYRPTLFAATLCGLASSLGALALQGYQGRLDDAGVDSRAARVLADASTPSRKRSDTLIAVAAVAGASAGAVFGHLGVRSVLASSLNCAVAAHAYTYAAAALAGTDDEAQLPPKAVVR